MDAIYLFSDGLPNAGPGLPPGGDKLSESEQGVHLGKYLRRKVRTWNQPIGGKKVNINAVGFFFESPDVALFVALAREHDGSFVGMSRPDTELRNRKLFSFLKGEVKARLQFRAWIVRR